MIDDMPKNMRKEGKMTKDREWAAIATEEEHLTGTSKRMRMEAKRSRKVMTGELTSDMIRTVHEGISSHKTTPLYVKRLMDFDYVDEGYMRQVLNSHFPRWNWEIIAYQLIDNGSSKHLDSILVHGRLYIYYEDGTERFFDALAGANIKYLRDKVTKEPTEVYVDLGNDMKTANTEAFKLAVNRLCNVSDDVYRKSVLTDEQCTELETLLAQLDGGTANGIKKAVQSHEVNVHNYDESMDKINKLIK